MAPLAESLPDDKHLLATTQPDSGDELTDDEDDETAEKVHSKVIAKKRKKQQPWKCGAPEKADSEKDGDSDTGGG